jgi:ATP phosphoribosyltransferase
LRENGLAVVEEIFPSTARLIVNRASYQLKAESMIKLIEAARSTIREGARADA